MNAPIDVDAFDCNIIREIIRKYNETFYQYNRLICVSIDVTIIDSFQLLQKFEQSSLSVRIILHLYYYVLVYPCINDNFNKITR